MHLIQQLFLRQWVFAIRSKGKISKERLQWGPRIIHWTIVWRSLYGLDVEKNPQNSALMQTSQFPLVLRLTSCVQNIKFQVSAWLLSSVDISCECECEAYLTTHGCFCSECFTGVEYRSTIATYSLQICDIKICIAFVIMVESFPLNYYFLGCCIVLRNDKKFSQKRIYTTLLKMVLRDFIL